MTRLLETNNDDACHDNQGEKMRLIRTMVTMGLAGAILMGCASTSSNKFFNLVPSIDQNENLPAWQAATENPLMYYVPDDAALIFMTQRSQDLHNPGLRMGYEFLGEFMPIREIRRAMRSYEKYKELAENFGLNPDGRLDAAVYFRDYYAVLHFTTENAQKTMEQIDLLIKDEGHGKHCQTIYKDGEIQEECHDLITISDAPGWRIYKLSDDGVPIIDFAIHQSTKVITLVAFESGKAFPEGVLDSASAPYIPKSIDKNAVFISQANHGKLAEFMLKQSFIVKEMDKEYFHSNDEINSICQNQSITACDGWGARYDRCEKAAESHCQPTQQTQCTDCASSSEARRDHEMVDSDDVFSNCDWTYSCRDCARNDSCYASLFNLNQGSHTDLLRMAGKTSIADDVCTNEIKSMFQNYPVTEYEAVVSDSGAIGFKVSTPIQSQETAKELLSHLTEHAEIDDTAAMFRGYLGMNAGTFLDYIDQSIQLKLEPQQFKCAQLTVLSKFYEEVRHEIKREVREIDSFARHLTSATVVLKSFTARYRNSSEYPVFWGRVENTPLNLGILSGLVSAMNNEFGPDYVQTKIDGNSMVAATSPYNAQTTQYKMVKDGKTFIEAHARKDLISQLLDGDATWLISDYDAYVTLDNGKLVISVMPE